MKNWFSSPKSSFWLCVLILGPALFIGQTLSAESSGRKVKQRVTPQYPEIARRFNTSGIVKLSVEITPGGDVRNVKVLGGHPLLIPAAEDAVRKWKYEPAKESTTEFVEFQFVPNQ
jgi:TonB family protein